MPADEPLGAAAPAAARSLTVQIGFDAGEPPVGFVLGEDGMQVAFTI